MPLFFKDPILGRLEDLLMEKALEEAHKRLVGKDSKEIYEAARDTVKAWLSQERGKVKMASSTYKQIACGKTEEALRETLARTQPSCYSVEIVDGIKTPLVLVIPLAVLKSAVVRVLAELLAMRIEFKDIRDESRLAFAAEAAQNYFLHVVKAAKKRGWSYEMNIPHGNKAAVVDIIKADWYHLGQDAKASRVGTIIFSTNGAKWWQTENKRLDFRPQRRRFSEDALKCWDLPSSFLETIKQ
jgi:hypothetical protein